MFGMFTRRGHCGNSQECGSGRLNRAPATVAERLVSVAFMSAIMGLLHELLLQRPRRQLVDRPRAAIEFHAMCANCAHPGVGAVPRVAFVVNFVANFVDPRCGVKLGPFLRM